jgi:hypothetical protein
MLERHYDGVQAYCQSKLAQVMFTFDLAEELRDRGVTANCLHPATYMPTKIVLADGISPSSSLAQGVQATLRLVADPELEGVSGRYFSGARLAQPHPQAHDAEARRRLRELSDRLCGLGQHRDQPAASSGPATPPRPSPREQQGAAYENSMKVRKGVHAARWYSSRRPPSRSRRRTAPRSLLPRAVSLADGCGDCSPSARCGRWQL